MSYISVLCSAAGSSAAVIRSGSAAGVVAVVLITVVRVVAVCITVTTIVRGVFAQDFALQQTFLQMVSR